MIVADVILLDVPVAEALLTFCLQEDAPLSAEAVELIKKETTEVGLHRLIHVRYGNSLFEHLVTIYVGVNLGRARRELRAHPGQLRPLSGRRKKLLQILI